jgi:hypothetical protein
MQDFYNYLMARFFPKTVDSISAPLTDMIGSLSNHSTVQGEKGHALTEEAETAFDESLKAQKLNQKLSELFA